MKYTKETSLRDFEAWSGGEDTLKVLTEKGDCEAVESLIEEAFYSEPPTETDVNDFLWFERDFIAESLGFDSWDAYAYGEDEDE